MAVRHRHVSTYSRSGKRPPPSISTNMHLCLLMICYTGGDSVLIHMFRLVIFFVKSLLSKMNKEVTSVK